MSSSRLARFLKVPCCILDCEHEDLVVFDDLFRWPVRLRRGVVSKMTFKLGGITHFCEGYAYTPIFIGSELAGTDELVDVSLDVVGHSTFSDTRHET